ncbi:STAS domain-containing protein [Paracoccus albus]|uniref:STAS domain-containing protein n=1 Tax=Paracoccus albus TaxID=3017784 RepID=UPI0022F11FC1|nr:STAS domain-containing protein [Paracoccus albus]WBU61226.1 STAS domain-containing protein [Paracoccus albus]
MSAGVTLAERLDLVAARPLARQISAIGGDLRLDASRVTFLGGLCLQIILAASQQCRSRGSDFEIVDASAQFADAIREFGVDQEKLQGTARNEP